MSFLDFLILEAIEASGWLVNYIFEARQERKRDEERRRERKEIQNNLKK